MADKHILRIHDTEANLLASLKDKQIAYATDIDCAIWRDGNDFHYLGSGKYWNGTQYVYDGIDVASVEIHDNMGNSKTLDYSSFFERSDIPTPALDGAFVISNTDGSFAVTDGVLAPPLYWDSANARFYLNGVTFRINGEVQLEQNKVLNLLDSTGASAGAIYFTGTEMRIESYAISSGGVVLSSSNGFEFTSPVKFSNNIEANVITDSLGSGNEIQLNDGLGNATINVGLGTLDITTGGVNINSSVGATEFNGVPLTNAGLGTNYLADDGTYKAVTESVSDINNIGAGAEVFKQITGSGIAEFRTLEDGSIIAFTQNANDVSIDDSRVVSTDTAQTITGAKTFSSDLTLDADLLATGVNSQIIGGFGANTGGGVKSWDDVSNARSGSGETLLFTDATNGSLPHSDDFYHPFSFEYQSRDGSGNLTQFAIPYRTQFGKLNYRTRFGGVWQEWAEFLISKPHATERVYNFPTSTNSSPLNGDIWFDGTNVQFREGGASKKLSDYVDLTSAQTITGAKTINNDLEVNEILAVGLTNSSEASLGQNLSMGATASYSWLQSWNSRPLRINGLGNAIEIGSLTRFLTYTNSSPSNGDIWFDGTNVQFREGGASKKLSDYVDLTSAQTITGAKTLAKGILADYSNTSANVFSRSSGAPAFYTNQNSTGDIQRWTKDSLATLVASVQNDGTITTIGKLDLGTYTNSSPTNGDIWFDGTNLKGREGGATFNLNGAGGGAGSWNTPTLDTNLEARTGYRVVRYRDNGNTDTKIEGVCKYKAGLSLAGGSNVTLFTLPVSFRPDAKVTGLCSVTYEGSWQTLTGVWYEILTTGEVKIYNGNATAISELYNISINTTFARS